MKRCPQCDFVYENDQRLCDFDGRELAAYETAALPPPEIAAPPQAVAPAVPPVKSRRGGFILLPVVAVMSAAVLYFAYYSIPRRAAPGDTSRSPVNLTASPQPEPSPVLAQPHAADAPSPAPPPSTPEVKTVRRAHPAVKRPPADARAPLPAQAEKLGVASPKKESKLGSIMKKTGRWLKKPFKL
jgi:hypothetical protein